MKAILIILAVLLVTAHPVAVAVVLGLELAAVAVLGWLIWRALRGSAPSPVRRWEP